MHELGQHRIVLERGALRILYSEIKALKVTKAFESYIVRLKKQAL